MEKIIRFSVSLPEGLLNELDKRVEELNYSSRSEFTRDLIREKIVKDEWENESENLVGILTVVYSHHQNDLISKMMELEHHSDVDVVCTTHIHMDHENCLETIIIKGQAKKIENLSTKISGLKGVKFSNLTKAGVVKL